MALNPIYLDLINEKIEGAYTFPYYFLCHRIPERTFKINKYYFPVCARCTGIYISGFTYFIITILIPIIYSIEILIFGLFLIIPMIIDGTSQLLNRRESTNKLRFLTGLFAGIGLVILGKTIQFIIFYII